MKRFVATVALALLLAGTFSAPAAAEFVFLDDFDGDALLPHWFQPAPSSWEHSVSGGMLHVTGLFSPSHPKSPGNFAAMSAPFAPQTDFVMDAWMGWEAGSSPHRLELRVLGPFGGGNPIIARFGYSFEDSSGPLPVIYAGAGGGPPITMPAPDPGIYQFSISRSSGQFNFYLNGSLVANFQDNFGTVAGHVGFFFLGPYPGELGAFHIDKVQVVPTPGAIAVLLSMTPFCARRRRRSMGRITT